MGRLFIFLLVAAAFPVWGGSVILKPKAEVAGPYVRLGEVAEVSGDPAWEEIFLGAAPAAGETARMSRQEVQRRMDYLGLGVQVEGAEEAELRLAPPASERQRLLEDLRAELARRLDALAAEGGSLWRLAPGELALPAAWRRAEVLALGSVRPEGGEVEASLRGSADGRTEEASLVVSVLRVRRVAVAARGLRANQILTSEDVALRELPATQIPLGAMDRVDACVGSLLLRPVAAEGILLASALVAPRLVSRGSLCVLSERAGKVRVRCQGKALADGRLDEWVPFEIVDSRKTVRARVRAVGEAELRLEEVPCDR
jgi:flagella basal body P-ring formation protein FlgA